jgi:hypothetical protein
MKYILYYKSHKPVWSEKWNEYIYFLLEKFNWIEIDISKFLNKKEVDILDVIPPDATNVLFFTFNSILTNPMNKTFINIDIF